MKALKGVLLLVFALVMLLWGAAVAGAGTAMALHHVGVELSWFAASAISFAILLLNVIVKAVGK